VIDGLVPSSRFVCDSDDDGQVRGISLCRLFHWKSYIITFPLNCDSDWNSFKTDCINDVPCMANQDEYNDKDLVWDLPLKDLRFEEKWGFEIWLNNLHLSLERLEIWVQDLIWDLPITGNVANKQTKRKTNMTTRPKTIPRKQYQNKLHYRDPSPGRGNEESTHFICGKQWRRRKLVLIYVSAFLALRIDSRYAKQQQHKQQLLADLDSSLSVWLISDVRT